MLTLSAGSTSKRASIEIHIESKAVFELMFQIPSTEMIPAIIPQPKFRLGECAIWSGVPNPDFGRIIGVLYTCEASCQATGLHYLILLDENSPSRAICTYDFAFEEDIKPLEQLREPNNDSV